MAYEVEVTDTFGGEPNYCWVKRYEIDGEGLTDRQLVRRAKALHGWTGVRCRVHDFGDMLEVRPYRILNVMFISWKD